MRGWGGTKSVEELLEKDRLRESGGGVEREGGREGGERERERERERGSKADARGKERSKKSYRGDFSPK